MNIALALEYPLQQRGGVEALVRALIEGLHDKLTLFLISPDHTEDLELDALQPGLSGHFSWNRETPIRSESLRMVQWAKTHGIELIHFHMGGTFNWNARSWSDCPITIAAKSGLRCITTNHQAITPFDANRASEPLTRRLASFVSRWPGKARQLAAVEKEHMVSRHDLRAARSGFPLHSGKLDHLYHSLLDGNTKPHSSDPNATHILNLATVAYRKGQHVLAEAFARIAGEFPNWQLHLVGYHAQQECVDQINGIIRKHGLETQIHLPGATNDPSGAIARCSIYVQPSLLEGLGLSLQEAQFHRRACIGTRVGGIPELIQDGRSGLLVPPSDPAAMADALRTLISDERLRTQFGEAGRKSILDQGMTREAMINRHLQIYAR